MRRDRRRSIDARLGRVLPLAAVTASLVASAVACAGRHTHVGGVVIAPESRADRVVFLIPAAEFLYGLTVTPCRSERPVWAVGTGGESSPPPARVVYGVVPTGYVERAAAQPLRPGGCYRVTVSGPASAEFVIGADGGVRPLASAGAPAATAP